MEKIVGQSCIIRLIAAIKNYINVSCVSKTNYDALKVRVDTLETQLTKLNEVLTKINGESHA